ncbi:MAG: class I SAM-dependent methyltransferase [Acidimicrobiia bacterium]
MSNLGKYATSNPLKRMLLNRFLEVVRSAVLPAAGPVLDIGSGEGMFWDPAAMPSPVIGLDVRADALAAGRDRAGLHPVVGDAAHLPFGDCEFDTVVAVEVLEHLADPAAAAAEMGRVCGRRAVVTVPWEPFFSLAVLLGSWRHVRRLGREPEHVNALGPGELKAMLAPYFRQVEVKSCFPWLIAEATV